MISHYNSPRYLLLLPDHRVQGHVAVVLASGVSARLGKAEHVHGYSYFLTCPGILTVHAQGQPGEGPEGVLGQAVQHLQAEAKEGGEEADD
jgi:hypothetical protein